MRSDIDLKIINSNLAVFRIGERYFKLSMKNPEKLTSAFENLKAGHFHEESQIEKALNKLLVNNQGTIEIDDANDLFRSVGINLDNTVDLSKIKVGIIGEDDLIRKYLHQNLRWDIINLNDENDEYDIGILMNRKFNYNMALKNNQILFENGKPYISLLFSPLSFELGPETLPEQTSCLRCKRLWELDNIDDGNLLSKFDESDSCGTPYILDEILSLAYSFLNTQILSTILNINGFNIQLGLTQHVLEYDYLNNNLTTHNLLKNPKCRLCFQKYYRSLNQTFEV